MANIPTNLPGLEQQNTQGSPKENPVIVPQMEPDKSRKNAILFGSIFSIIALIVILIFIFSPGDSSKSAKNLNLPEAKNDIADELPATSSVEKIPEQTKQTETPTVSDIDSLRTGTKTPVYPVEKTSSPTPSLSDPATEKLQTQYLNQLEKFIYGKTGTGEDLSKLEPLVVMSPYAGKITIRSVARPSSGEPVDEYVILSVKKDLTTNLQLTGLKLKSLATGQTVIIGEGVYLPYANSVNYKEAVWLEPGVTIYIISGQSPVGYSFRPNICSGYWNQFQKFKPSLRSECPKIIYELPAELPPAFNDSCADYVKKMSACKIHVDKSTDPEVMVKDPYYQITAECRQFIDRHAGYNNCVNLHKNESDFYKKEWRMYLGRTTTAWKTKREVIQLLDTNDKVIAQYSY